MNSVKTTIHGTCLPKFEPVRDAFSNNFIHHNEIGAALAIYHHGELVVDLWGGLADPQTQQPWVKDTITYIHSTTKGILATCVNLLIQQGRLEIDRPVAHYWPEFANSGKKDIPVRWLLTHQAGLSYLDHPIPLDDALRWYPIIDALAAQTPLWTPGDGHGYHCQTFGWLVGEIIRRITGMTPGHYFRNTIAEPLGLDFWIGLPERHHARFAPIIEPHPINIASILKLLPDTIPPIDPNDPRVQEAEIPSSNGIGTARSLARLYAALIDDIDPLLNAETLANAITENVSGHDRTFNRHTRFGIGYELPTSVYPFLSEQSFGHGGKGGSLGFADIEHRIAFGYIMNRMRPGGYVADNRWTNLINALHHALR